MIAAKARDSEGTLMPARYTLVSRRHPTAHLLIAVKPETGRYSLPVKKKPKSCVYKYVCLQCEMLQK